MEGFAVAFESCGFQRNAFYPCYGLSEATLIVSGGDRSTPPVIQTFDSAMLERHQVQEQRPEVPTTYDAGKADFTSANRPSNVRALVGCGQCLGSQQIVIADPVACTRCPPDRIGEIWLSGPCVAHGYWNHPEETQQAFQAYLSDTGQGPFLRTGDIGFIKNGELFVTGRLKEMIIIRGRNHYPHDIERTVEQSHPALQPQGAAAFGVDVDGEERLVILQELVPHFRRWDTEEVLESLREAVTVEHELQVHALWLLKAGSIPKTTSGKTQRRTCRDSFLQGKFEAIAIWRQG
jgi:acyl-CoA synthetase (AMP-forming)/AMP-acid ligase II